MADEALNEFLEAYDLYRVKDQERYYSDRAKQYVAANRQAGNFAEGLLALAGVSGAVAAFSPEYALWLGVLAAAFAATATVIAGWADLVGFSKNAQLFRSAEDRLAYARPDRPMDSGVEDKEATVYIDRMEDILLGEVRAWGKEWGHPGNNPPSSD